MKKIILKEGREKSLLRGHPWIFSGAIKHWPECEDGDVLSIYSSNLQFLAKGYFHTQNSLAGRILSFTDKDIKEIIREKLLNAHKMRENLLKNTNCYRLINAEGDGLSGLIVDHYSGVYVIQISTCGMEKLRPLLVELLIELFKPVGIYEKSSSSSREQEGLAESIGTLYGNVPEEVEVIENGIRFLAPLTKGQKTGLFLDQRSMRQKIGKLSKGKRVLNCFAYTGGFSLYALQAGAKEVVSVDISADACALNRKNTSAFKNHTICEMLVSSFLKHDPLNFDIIILDPPAFAKSRKDVEAACKGYVELNRQAIDKMAPGSLLLTCSCSYFIDQALFQNLVSQASILKQVKILEKHTQALDHPTDVNHPEGEYLKSLLLYIS